MDLRLHDFSRPWGLDEVGLSLLLQANLGNSQQAPLSPAHDGQHTNPLASPSNPERALRASLQITSDCWDRLAAPDGRSREERYLSKGLPIRQICSALLIWSDLDPGLSATEMIHRPGQGCRENVLQDSVAAVPQA